jgi:hypothetical protein
MTPEAVGFQNQTLNEPQPSGGQPAFQSGELEQGIRPTKWGKFVESLKQTSVDSPVGFMPGFEGAWSRLAAQTAMEREFDRANKQKISPEEANRRYPGLPVPFAEPVYPELADLIYTDNERRRQLQAWVDRGPETGRLFGFAAASGVALDPVNLALNVAGGAAVKAIGITPSLLTSFGENLAINAATEIPSFIQQRRERQAVTVGESALNVVAGSALGTGIGKTLEMAGHFFGRTSERIKERNLKAAVLQHEAGVKTDVTPSVVTGALREAGAVQPGVENPYQFRELGHPSEVTHYAARDAETNQPMTFGRNYGEGQYAVDDGVVANNHAANPESEMTGRVQEVKIPEDAKILSLSSPADSEQGAPFVKALEEKFGKLELPEGATLEQALQAVDTLSAAGKLKESAMQEATQAAKALGYDGYSFVAEHGGVARHNGVVLFDEAKAQLGNEFTANKDIVPQMSEGEAQAQSDRSAEQSKFASPEVDQEIQRLQASRPEVPKGIELDPVLEAQVKQADAILKERAASDPALEEELQGLRAQEALDKQEAQAMRDFADCIIQETL